MLSSNANNKIIRLSLLLSDELNESRFRFVSLPVIDEVLVEYSSDIVSPYTIQKPRKNAWPLHLHIIY